jgi:hypothetical protein
VPDEVADCRADLGRIGIVDFTRVESEDSPEIIECQIRLHSGPPAKTGDGEPSWTDWSETVVGTAVTFKAVAMTTKGSWNGPLSPGVEISPPVPVSDPYWTVFLPAGRGVPVMVGQVGHALGVGEAFRLPAGELGVWTEGVVFEGTIVTD